MARSTIRLLFGIVALTLLLPAPVRGQLASGSIIGTVRDSTGAVMQAVSVSAKSLDTGAVRTATTDNAGTYQILSVAAGDYEVQAAASGFQTSIRSRVAVTVGAAVSVNFALELGGIQQDVSVSAEAPQVNTTDASLGGLVGEREVRELPLNGRDAEVDVQAAARARVREVVDDESIDEKDVAGRPIA